MNEKAVRPLYDPPRVVDLSSFSMNGQSEISGVCTIGRYNDR